jgi:hypothetical protein
MGVNMENSDVDEIDTHDLSYCIYPIGDAPPKSPEIFYGEWIKKHGGKIPILHASDRDFVCDLFLRDVKIRKKTKEFISETSLREKLSSLFF